MPPAIGVQAKCRRRRQLKLHQRLRSRPEFMLSLSKQRLESNLRRQVSQLLP